MTNHNSYPPFSDIPSSEKNYKIAPALTVHKHLDELQTLLAPFHIDTIYTDDNYAYKKHITESTVVTGKRNTQRIERNHLSLRTWCSRLVRKGIRFSKLHFMHRIVIGLIINCRFWGRPLPVRLL